MLSKILKDALNFKEWENDALGHIKIRTKFREICSTGLINLSRIFKKPGKVFFILGLPKSLLGKK